MGDVRAHRARLPHLILRYTIYYLNTCRKTGGCLSRSGGDPQPGNQADHRPGRDRRSVGGVRVRGPGRADGLPRRVSSSPGDRVCRAVIPGSAPTHARVLTGLPTGRSVDVLRYWISPRTLQLRLVFAPRAVGSQLRVSEGRGRSCPSPPSDRCPRQVAAEHRDYPDRPRVTAGSKWARYCPPTYILYRISRYRILTDRLWDGLPPLPVDRRHGVSRTYLGPRDTGPPGCGAFASRSNEM